MLRTGKRPTGAPPRGGDELESLQLLHRSGRVDEAIAALKSLVQSQPKSARFRVKLSEWLAEAGRREEAITTLFALQELLMASGNPIAAISAGVKIVELDPTFDNPLSFVAKVNATRLREERARESESAEPSFDPDLPSEESQTLAGIPLLSELGPEELASVASGMRRRLLSPGAVVFEKGENSRSLSFVVSGMLEIRNEGKRLDTAAAGQCLGEFAFLTGEPRSATVIAVAESEVLELPYEAMQSVVESHPRVASVLDRMYHGRVLARVLAESPLFEYMDAGERHRVASRFEFMQIPAGIRIVEVGSQDGSLFLVKRGGIEIRNDRDQVLGAIGPNEFFGEVSFLTDVPRTASATTTQDSELLRIDRDALSELTVEHPRLVEVLKKFHLDRVQNAISIAKTATRA
jgi:CRP-like cAMP-binding protein